MYGLGWCGVVCVCVCACVCVCVWVGGGWGVEGGGHARARAGRRHLLQAAHIAQVPGRRGGGGQVRPAGGNLAALPGCTRSLPPRLPARRFASVAPSEPGPGCCDQLLPPVRLPTRQPWSLTRHKHNHGLHAIPLHALPAQPGVAPRMILIPAPGRGSRFGRMDGGLAQVPKQAHGVGSHTFSQVHRLNSGSRPGACHAHDLHSLEA